MFINITDYGAKGNANYYNAGNYYVDSALTILANNDTVAIVTAINDCINSGKGQIEFPNGNFLFDQIVIDKIGNVDITLQGTSNTILLANPTLTTDAIVIKSSAATTGLNFLRKFKIIDMCIQGKIDRYGGDSSNRRGVLLSGVQDICFDNVWISQFNPGGLILSDCYDSVFINVQVAYCGDDITQKYAVVLDGVFDNSNANHFIGCHVEMNALMLNIKSARHNSFIDCKFEHGKPNNSTLSPIFIQYAGENSFDDCMLIETHSSTTYLITSDGTLSSYFTAHNYSKMTAFNNCKFATPSNIDGAYVNGYYMKFKNCIFNGCNGNQGNSAINTYDYVDMVGCTLTFQTSGINAFRINGKHTKITGNTLTYSTSTPTGWIYQIGSCTKTIVKDNTIEMPVNYALFFTSTNYFANNVFENKEDATINITGGGTPSVFMKNTIILNDSITQTYTNFINTYEGQEITLLYLGGANVIISNNGNIVTSSMANITLNNNQSIKLKNIGGIWHQI